MSNSHITNLVNALTNKISTIVNNHNINNSAHSTLFNAKADNNHNHTADEITDIVAYPNIGTSANATQTAINTNIDLELSNKMDIPLGINGDVDLNDYTSPGMYYCGGTQAVVATISNLPSACDSGFSLLVEYMGTWSNGIKQTVTEYDTNNTWIRNFYVNGNEVFVDSGWKLISYDGHTHDDRYFTETEMNTKLTWKTASLTNMSGCTLYYNDYLCVFHVNGTYTLTTSANTYKALVSGTIPSSYRPKVNTTGLSDGGAIIRIKVNTDGALQVCTASAFSNTSSALRCGLVWKR